VQLATRLGTPVVAIFGPTDPGRTGPLGPCRLVVCPSHGRSDHMRSISVAKVEAATIDLAEEARNPA
jgi:ADP-heptose:LPS heptosyltransferase